MKKEKVLLAIRSKGEGGTLYFHDPDHEHIRGQLSCQYSIGDNRGHGKQFTMFEVERGKTPQESQENLKAYKEKARWNHVKGNWTWEKVAEEQEQKYSIVQDCTGEMDITVYVAYIYGVCDGRRIDTFVVPAKSGGHTLEQAMANLDDTLEYWLNRSEKCSNANFRARILFDPSTVSLTREEAFVLHEYGLPIYATSSSSSRFRIAYLEDVLKIDVPHGNKSVVATDELFYYELREEPAL
jgi:hypothetical protein